jgi:tetratricopeptide (TPR) repeat protein
MNNAEQIEKLSKALTDNNIKEIKITGYASPEGPYNFNKTLAAHRAEAVKKHISASNSTANIVVDSYPANWEEIKAKLSSSYIENWQGIVAIIDDATISAADKNNAIRKKYPVEYDFMLNTWYPKLRAADISIERNQLKMSAAEVKKSVQSNPSQLSLDDIYLIALTYEKGSKEWDELILIAVENYPQSPEARVNAANVAMANGDYTAAEQYLQGVPANMPEAMNSRGILAMAQGDYSKALGLFQQALSAGVTEAAYNITLVRELMNAAQ